MSTSNRSAEELKAELEAQQKATEEQIDGAAAEAGRTAEASGATPEEVQKAVEKARKEEKDKLYPQLESLKDAMKEIQQTLREEREEKAQIKQEAADKEERRRQEKLSDGEKTLEAIHKLEEKLEQERKAREASDQRWEQAEQKREVAEYRASVIEAAKGEIIEDIVHGLTVEEIDRTAEIAKVRYAEFAERFKNVQGGQVRNELGRTSSNPDTAALEEQELNERLTAVDHDKYLKDPEYREQIQNALAHAYTQAAGRA